MLDTYRVLCRERADGSSEGLIKTLEDVPADYRYLLRHKRHLGQRNLPSGKVLDRLNMYHKEEAAGSSAAAAARKGEDGRLSSSNLHQLMMAFAGACRLLATKRLARSSLHTMTTGTYYLMTWRSMPLVLVIRNHFLCSRMLSQHC